ncbi:DUF4012 domain-containing protein [Aeromicrobium sp. 9AM]|uniref:DUF4012 domain-containing protein n=1 Tax=Aeromicrobium sp. 9AM TaxID=2653126 RepID=UPI0012EFCB45|nr:DUF4012 domain-containing protein [Aeromicrobium sp. 9AM]VXB52973.1 conserved hypothetical protein [Aeromicrobium sp. 9AM]
MPSKLSRRMVLVGAEVVVVFVVVGLAAYSYGKLSSARGDLNLAADDAAALQAALTAGDQSRAETELAQLRSHIGSAQSSLHSPLLSIGAKTPVLGKNITAVRTVASAVGSVADDGLPPLVEVAEQFSAKTFNPRNGRINVRAIARLTPNISSAAAAIQAASVRLQAIDTSSLMGQVQGPVRDAQDKIKVAANIAHRASIATKVVPQMLDGEHTYLLIFQNNAEIRATGGLPGAYAELKVDNGRIGLGKQGAGSSMGELPGPVVPISSEERKLFDTKLASDFRDINFTPDFPRAAQIGADIYKQEKGRTVDGVLSLDPVTLSYLLKGVGPVDLEDGTALRTDNAVDVLLNDAYVKYPDPVKQDTFFASAAREIFDRVLTGAGDPTSILKLLSRAASERRVAVWAKDTSVQRELANTALAGTLPVGKSARPALGFYLNDATGAKMEYYLQYSVTAKSVTCTDAGVQTYESEMRLHSIAPADSSSLPKSIQGPGFGAVPGSMLMNLYLYGPDAGAIKRVTIDDKSTTFTRGTHDGRPVVIVTVQVDPGKTVTVQSTTMSGEGQRGGAAVAVTPSVEPGKTLTSVKSSCD